GSGIRPIKMLEALKRSGVDLDVIEGKYSDRKLKIKSIKQEILSGKKKIDLVYFENLSGPFFYTYRRFAKVTFPAPILVDLFFLIFCLRKKIKVAYFFRDIYWNFKEAYGDDISRKRLFFMRKMGQLELRLIKKVANKIYVPSEPFANYIKDEFNVDAHPLPPGSDIELTDAPCSTILKFMFVGGCGLLYDPALLFRVFSEFPAGKICLEYCTREDEWMANKYKYPNLNPQNIVITHKSGKRLRELYGTSDIALYLVPPSKYMQLAMAVKSAEYIMAGKPIIAYEGTPLATLIQKHDIGWVIPYEGAALKDLIARILINRDEIALKIDNLMKVRHQFTWDKVVDNVLEVSAV
ncbi:MAG: hypothetical protein P1U32_08855, partial [Legionellaceae bacterium]|nr:hypothetical protein [Legionellaceae bacterium]